jgi:hypothetical protein
MNPLDSIIHKHLPETADGLRHLIGQSRENVYAALVRLYDDGRATIEPRYRDNKRQTAVWWPK